MAKWLDAPVIDEPVEQPAWMSAPIVEEPTVPRETSEEAGKRAKETFQFAVDKGVSLDEADREVAAEAAAKPAEPVYKRLTTQDAKAVQQGVQEAVAHNAARGIELTPEQQERTRTTLERNLVSNRHERAWMEMWPEASDEEKTAIARDIIRRAGRFGTWIEWPHPSLPTLPQPEHIEMLRETPGLTQPERDVVERMARAARPVSEEVLAKAGYFGSGVINLFGLADRFVPGLAEWVAEHERAEPKVTTLDIQRAMREIMSLPLEFAAIGGLFRALSAASPVAAQLIEKVPGLRRVVPPARRLLNFAWLSRKAPATAKVLEVGLRQGLKGVGVSVPVAAAEALARDMTWDAALENWGYTAAMLGTFSAVMGMAGQIDAIRYANRLKAAVIKESQARDHAVLQGAQRLTTQAHRETPTGHDPGIEGAFRSLQVETVLADGTRVPNWFLQGPNFDQPRYPAFRGPTGTGTTREAALRAWHNYFWQRYRTGVHLALIDEQVAGIRGALSKAAQKQWVPGRPLKTPAEVATEIFRRGVPAVRAPAEPGIAPRPAERVAPARAGVPPAAPRVPPPAVPAVLGVPPTVPPAPAVPAVVPIAQVPEPAAEVPVAPPAPEVAPVPEKPPEVAPTPPAEAVVPAEEVVAEAPEVIEGEEVPLEVRAAEAPELLTPEAARIQSYLRGLSAQELPRFLKRIPGPYGGTLAETLGVGKATKVLATAQKKLRAEEAAAKKALAETKAAYPDALVEAEAIAADEASLLGILGPKGRVTYRKGVEHGAETAEAIEGRSLAIRRHFTKAEGMTLEDLQMAWAEQRGIPAKDAPSLGETFGRLMGEIETFEAAKAEGRAPLEQQLRDLAANVPEEVSEELLAGADRLSEAQGTVWSAHDTLLEEATPYLVAEEMAAPISAEVEVMERDAAAKVARADQALRQAEAARTLADRGAITVAEQTKVLKAAAKLSGVPHVASILRAVARATTPEGLEAARERLAWALERHVKREHAHRAARMARRIESWARRQKFDPRDRRAAVLLQMASDTSETGLMLQDLEVVKARERVLAEGLYEYQTADELIKSDAETRATALAGTLRGEMDENALGRIDRAEVARADVGLVRGLPHYMYKALTTLEQVFGPDSQAEKLFFEFSLGKEDESTGARAYYRLLRREDAWLNSELSEATGMDRLKKSERFVDWITRPLVLDLPDAGRVELAVDEWMGLVNTAKDRDGDLQVALVPLVRAANRAEAPFAEALTNTDRQAMFSALDKADPRILKAADVYWRWHQDKERFRKWSEAWHAIKGWWPEELPDYYPLHRDIPREAPSLLRVPGMEETVADRMAHAVREVGFMQERIPDAVSPLLIKGAELEYLAHSRTGSALVAYGVPAKNIEKVLNAGEPSFLRQMEATVGRTVARSVWVDTVRHVLETAGLSPGAGIQGNQRLEQLAHQGMSNIGVAYFVASPFTARSQLFGIFGKLSDPSSPTSLGDFLVGIGEALRHPLRYWHELAELSPLVENRVAHAPALYMFGDVREAQGRRPIWALARYWRQLKAAAVKKLFWARHTDAWTQVARYRTNYRYWQRQGLSPDEARAKAARMTEMDIENQDFPAHAGSADMLSQQARRGILKRGLVFAGQSRASQANLLIRNFNRFRRDKDVKKFLKSIIGVLLTAIGISATNVLRRLARYKALREPGKAAGEFVVELLTSILGNVHVVRQFAASVRYFYGGVQALPVLGPVDDLVGAVRSLYGLIDKWDEKKAWRAAWRMSYATAILCGIPVSGAHGMYRIVEGLMPEEARRGVGSRQMREGGAGGRGMRETVGSRTMKED